MCGIAAIVPKRNTSLVNVKSLQQMLVKMSHRGPDSTGYHVAPGIGLAMNRLAIVGGSTGLQPIFNEQQTLVVVCNGEIYNHQLLRATLEEQGHVFRSTSDAEVLVHLFEDCGIRMVECLEGIFSFALWDTIASTLWVARDKMGVKPLYYASTGNETFVASELQALTAHPGISTNLCPLSVKEYHTFRYVPGHRTVVEGVYKLKPAQWAMIREGQMEIRTYWSMKNIVKSNRLTSSLTSNRQNLLGVLRDAVSSQQAPAVRSGLFLSGGLDSSAILALTPKAARAELDTFTVAFERPTERTAQSEFNELQEAGEVAAHFGVRHVTGCYTASEVLTCLPEILAALDEPIADPTAIPLWFVSRLAHNHGCRVVFSGEGLDELFNGYSLYRQVYWLQALERMPRRVREAMLKWLPRMKLPGAGVLTRSLNPVHKWYQGIGGVFQENELPKILQLNAQASEKSQMRPFMEQVLAGLEGTSVLTQLTQFDLAAWLPDNTLMKSDKISMAHHLELRVPFLHGPVVEFALQTEDKLKLHGRTGKWIVRQALRDVLPHNVIYRKKVGFPVPVTAWMFGEWQEYARYVLLGPGSATREIYHASEIERLFRSEGDCKPRAARLLWSLLTFTLWYERFQQQLEAKQSTAAVSQA